jgi:hypothetical protein
VTLGQTTHTWYNFVVAPVDNPWWGSGYNMVSYTLRSDNAVTYAGSFGAVAVGLTGYFALDSEEEAPDGTEVGVSFPIGDLTLAFGVQDIEVVDDAVTGVALSGLTLGDVALAFNAQANDDDTSFAIDIGIGNAYVHIETISLDAADADPMSVTLGYTQSLGRKTTMWYEVVSADADSGDSDDDLTVVRAVLKYDII